MSKITVDIASAIGKARAWIYAVWVCNGYNPCDGLFWGVYHNGLPPSDKAWAIVSPDIIKKLGPTLDIPEDILS